MDQLKIEKACINAAEKIEKLGDSALDEVKDKLNWVLGSYRNDKNPEGLYEIGEMALKKLKEVKKKKPKAVSKKLIEDLEKALKEKK